MFREKNKPHLSLRILSHLFIPACFPASLPGQPAIIDGTMNSELYLQILKENVRTSV